MKPATCRLIGRGAPRAIALAALLTCSACSYWPFDNGDNGGPEADTTQPQPAIEVRLSGVDESIVPSVLAHLSLYKKSCATPPAYVRALLERAHEETLTALRAHGHYSARVGIARSDAADCVAVDIAVEPGPRVTIGNVDIRIEGEAAADDGFANLVSRPPVSSGTPLKHDDYAASKALIESVALQRGYLLGRFTRHSLRVDPARGVADIEIHYDSGPRFALGGLRINQDPHTVDEALVRRFLEHADGAPYDSNVISNYYGALSASEYFERVDVRPLLSEADAQAIPVDIRLTPRKRHKYRAGLGASTDEGIRGLFSYANRRLNTGGHRLTGEVRASVIEQRLSGAYSIPRRHPADEWFNIEAGIRREDIDTFDTLETQIGVSETKRRPWGWMETRFVNYNRQSFDIASDDRTSNLIIPGLRWNKTTADDPLYPTRGYALSIEVRGAAETLASDVDFARASISGSTVYGLPWRMRLLGRLATGYNWVSDFRDLPPSERFFAGGDRSIRGYDFEDLGPVDDTGDVIGGRYLAVASLELEKLLTERWGVAAFVDAGNAFGGVGSATGVKLGLGAGIRWRSPIGPARIDFAHPLDDDTVLRVHLRIGPDL